MVTAQQQSEILVRGMFRGMFCCAVFNHFSSLELSFKTENKTTSMNEKKFSIHIIATGDKIKTPSDFN